MINTPGTQRQAWSTPSLDRLTVDLNAIAGNKKNGNDAVGGGKEKS